MIYNGILNIHSYLSDLFMEVVQIIQKLIARIFHTLDDRLKVCLILE